jgi:hypothetical protein
MIIKEYKLKNIGVQKLSIPVIELFSIYQQDYVPHLIVGEHEENHPYFKNLFQEVEIISLLAEEQSPQCWGKYLGKTFNMDKNSKFWFGIIKG